jgi:phosphatidylglycerol---prolipoprotein diacylglyceryl transferase
VLLDLLAAAGNAIHFRDLGLDPVALPIWIGDRHIFDIKWYSLAYITGIVLGWWYLVKLLDQPGAPMARRHADDLMFYATLGIILGGRIGYLLFYAPELLSRPLKAVSLWDGGMSFHGGVIGTTLAIILLARQNGLNWLRVHDYVACVVPFGLFFGRLANFVNGELWGHTTTVAWGIIFPGGGGLPRHPSQLYEAALEGVLLFLVLFFTFWRTKARYDPGKLTGIFLLGYGLSRYFVEFFREADRQYLDHPILGTPGLHMGQLLCVPMIAGGLYLIATAKGRRERVEPIAGTESVA